tara:strand:+ start:378 stop:818 length:441 start_codon:yes stop_codon:yes gene_type:complete
MITSTKENHALTNCMNQLESIKENYRNYKEAESNDDYKAQDEIRESVLNSALSVEFRGGWYSSPESIADLKPEEFKILLSWGGPACRVIGDLDQYNQPTDIEIQYQDWGTSWENLQLNPHYAGLNVNITDDIEALEWFCSCFYFGE